MEFLRALLSLFLFCFSTYLLLDLFVNGFDGVVLVAVIGGYIAVHYIWPRGGRYNGDWYDLLELVLDLPFRALALLLRSVGTLFGGKGSGVDLDL